MFLQLQFEAFYTVDLLNAKWKVVHYMCAKRIKFIITRLSVCSLRVSCNEMIDDVTRSTLKWSSGDLSFEPFYLKESKSDQAENSLVLPTMSV